MTMQDDAAEAVERDGSEPVALGPGALVLSCVFAFVVGGIAGALTTFAHAQAVPWMLLAGLAIEIALVIGFRIVFLHRLAGILGVTGFAVGGALLLLPGAGPAVLPFTSWTDVVWIVTAVLLGVAAAVLPWPGRHPHRP